MIEPHPLKKNWQWKTIGEICDPPQYGWTTKANQSGKLHLLRTTDITSGSIDWDTVPYCSEEPPNKEKYILKDGDVVISRAGSVGYSSLISNPEQAVFASYLIRFRPNINKKYFYYFLQSPLYWKDISENKLGIAIPNVNASKLSKIPVPIPPLPEQERIVAKIEELFTQLDAGTAALKRAQAGLKRYKASVLKAAFEGNLVPQDPNDEPAQVLLAKQGMKSLENDNFPKLPSGWCWTPISELTLPITKIIPQHDLSGTFDYIDISSIDNKNNQIFAPKTYTADKAPSRARQIIHANDIVFSTVRTYLRNIALVPERLDGQIASTGFSVLRTSEVLYPKLLFYYCLSDAFLNPLTELQRGTNYPAVRENDVRNQLFPLPPKNEQKLIVDDIDTRLSVIEKLEYICSINIVRNEQLRQSILRSAFSGKLLSHSGFVTEEV